ncbi:hypothetical protein D1007_25954 [Hordeum vulgare]|nr:hypothetical protein D1007_25954 [Hordeum vulgare]
MPSTLPLQRPARPPPATPLPPPPQPPYRSAASSSCLGAVCIAVTKASSVFTSGTYILKEYDLVAGMDLNAHPFPDLTGTNSLRCMLVLKTSTYTTKQNVVYGTIRSTDPRTKVGGLELGAEFALMRIDQPILDSEELIRAKDN